MNDHKLKRETKIVRVQNQTLNAKLVSHSQEQTFCGWTTFALVSTVNNMLLSNSQ